MTEVLLHFPENASLTATKNSGAYTLGVLGVRCTPCETKHDVTFSRSRDQGKITKTL